MAGITNHLDEIKESSAILKAFRKSAELFSNEKEVLALEKQRYALCYAQIHEWLAPKRTEAAEAEIREIIKEVFALDLPVCEAKIKRFQEGLEKCQRKGSEQYVNNYYSYLQEWLTLYEQNYALVAFRSLEHWALFSEWDKPEADKFWKYSIDTFNDGGLTGCTKGFFYYANQMVLDNKVRFILKQMPTSFGKCVEENTEVLTPCGYRKIKDLGVGDIVCSMQANEIVNKKILNKWNTIKSQVRVRSRGGKEIVVSPEHKLYTQRGYIKAGELTVDDYIYRLCSEYEPEEPYLISDEELTFITCMLFDGHCKYPQYGFTKMPETKIMAKFRDSLDRLGIKYTMYPKQGTSCETCRVLQNDFIAKGLIEKYGLEGKLSKEKRLPEQFFNLSLENKFKLIGLMFATDGYVCKNSSSGITLASKELVSDLSKLLDSCGVYSYIAKKDVKLDGKLFEEWQLIIPSYYMQKLYGKVYCYDKQEEMERYAVEEPFGTINSNYPKELFIDKKGFRQKVRKQWARNRCFKQCLVEKYNSLTHELDDIVYKDFVWDKIMQVDVLEEKCKMVDIEVEGTHNFVANNIVSHNSFSDSVMISFIFGVDRTEQVIKVVGNRSLPSKCTRQVVDLMCSKRFLQVFPEYAKDIDWEKDISAQIFSTCSIKDGILTIKDSGRDTSYESFSKETKRDGIRGGYLFLDDIVQRKEIMNLKQHSEDADDYDGTWKKRARDEKKFRIVCGGTTYDPYDLLMTLKFRYSKGKVKKSPINKYTTLSMDEDAAFISVPKLDENDQLTFPQKTVLSEVLQDRRNNPGLFAAMDMQKPLAPENTPFYWDYLQTYDFIPKDDDSTRVCLAALDPARTGKNYVSMPIFTKVLEVNSRLKTLTENYYLVDALYLKAPMESVYDTICDLIIQHNIVKLLVERNTDTSLKYLLDKKLQERGVSFCEIEEVYSIANKEARIYADENVIKTRIVFPNREMYGRASHIGQFMEDIVSYKYEKAEYDDSIDSVSLFVDRFVRQKNIKAKAKVLFV